MTPETCAVLLADPRWRASAVAQVLARFRGLPVLDMLGPAKRCRGIAAERMDRAGAEALARAFLQAGIPAVVVADARLPRAPASQPVRRLEYDDHGIRPETGAAFGWGEITVIMVAGLKDAGAAQGRAGRMSPEDSAAETFEDLTAYSAGDWVGGLAKRLQAAAAAPLPRSPEPETAYYLGLLTAEPRHLWIDAQRFDFSCLKGLKQLGSLPNLRILLAELSRRAPGARLSLGARALAEGRPLVEFVCDSPAEIEREYRWLLALNAQGSPEPLPAADAAETPAPEPARSKEPAQAAAAVEAPQFVLPDAVVSIGRRVIRGHLVLAPEALYCFIERMELAPGPVAWAASGLAALTGGLLSGWAAQKAASALEGEDVEGLPFPLVPREEAAPLYEPCLKTAPRISLCGRFFRIPRADVLAVAIPEEDILLVRTRQDACLELRAVMEEETVSGRLKLWRYPMGPVSRGRGRRFALGLGCAAVAAGAFLLDWVELAHGVLGAGRWFLGLPLLRRFFFDGEELRPESLIVLLPIVGFIAVYVKHRVSRGKDLFD
ncbi:MAG: hypothetical protein HY926_10640 [Elusimicrobia bacterium]|nr:hypothetical protein [Elusimicrobiota bacterium]